LVVVNLLAVPWKSRQRLREAPLLPHRDSAEPLS
jgi:hypothetical protein